MIHLHDAILFDGLRRTDDGYLVATAKVARTGVQIYAGSDVGKPDIASIRIYRPEAEVFSRDALHSFAHRPVTIDHPSVAVTAENWREHAVGQTGDEVARDGEFIRVPLVLMDAKAIKSVEDGKRRQLSMGYTCDVAFEPGISPQGEAYDAIQRNIRGNHLAVVTAARGGPELKLGDEERNTEMADTAKTRTVLVDGLSVETTDQGAQAIEKLQRDAKTASDVATAKATTDAAKIAEQAKAIETKDGEIAALKQKLTDAELTPQKLDAAVTARGKVIADAKKIAPSIVTDGKSDAEIRKAAVIVKLGEPAKTMTDAAIEGAFAALVPAGQQHDHLATVLSDPQRIDDADTIQAKRKAVMSNAWQAQATKAA